MRGLAAAVAVEATGGFETVVAATLAAAGSAGCGGQPGTGPCILPQAVGRRAKTDPIDAAVIARFAEATKPQVRPLPDAATQVLAELVARRRQIIEMLVAERQRERRLPVEACGRALGASSRRCETELTALDQEIDGTVRGSPVWREKEDLLASVPGIGPTIARTLIAELPELGSLDRRRSPLSPASRRSPAIRTMEGQELHRRRTRPVRHGALHGAPRGHLATIPPSGPSINASLDAGKPKMVALIAVARKLLTILNAILRDKNPWQTA